MGKMSELKHEFSNMKGQAFLDEVVKRLEKAVELKEQGQELEGDKVVNEMKAWLEERIQTIEKSLPQNDEIVVERSSLPKNGDLVAVGDKVRLCVIKEEEREKYLAVSYEYSFMKSAFKKEKFREELWGDLISDDAFVCSIYDKYTDEFVGYCSIKHLGIKDWEMAIELFPEVCHKGYGTEALPLLMNELHMLTGKRFFCARVEIDNHPSQGLMKKIGGKPDGVSEFLLHGDEIEKFQKEHMDEITDEIREVATEFCMEAEEILGYVLQYRFDIENMLS